MHCTCNEEITGDQTMCFSVVQRWMLEWRRSKTKLKGDIGEYIHTIFIHKFIKIDQIYVKKP